MTVRPAHPLRLAGWSLLAALLALPAVAKWFTDQVHWTVGDFGAAALLLGTLGIGVELAARLPVGRLARVGAALACLGAVASVWVLLATG